MMTSAQVVETSVTITDNSPSQDYTHPDDQTTLLHVGFLLWRHCDVGLDKMHTPGGVENIRPVAENVLLSLWSTRME